MKILVVIPARSGSKGLINKNIKLLNGKPLINYSIEVAKEVFDNKDICFSSDSQEYINIAEKTGIKVPFIRALSLATDSTSTREVILNCVAFYEQKNIFYDAVLLLQVTSPFRTKKHLNEVINLYKKEYDMIVSVKETDSNPYYVLAEENDAGYLEKSKKSNFTRRQDCPSVWEYNGSIYLININSLKNKDFSEFDKVKKYVMESKYSIDIDSQLDFDYAEFIQKKLLL